MSIISALPYSLTNGTTADATQVMANFNQIYNNVNANAAENATNSSITTLTGLTSVTSGVNFSGSATAVTRAATDSSTKLATTAFVQAALQALYPVGSLYLSTSSTNPGTTFGFGTWSAYAQGLAIVGVGTGTDVNSNTQTVAGGTQYGEYVHTLSTGEMPSHTHSDSGHQHNPPFQIYYNSADGALGAPGGGNAAFRNYAMQTSYANIQNTGGGGAHNNIQPSIGVYIWQRTA